MYPKKHKPRLGKHAECTGAYEQSIKLITPVINQGDLVLAEQYFTGYGKIDSAKIAFYPSASIFDGDKSFIVNGIKNQNGKLLNGASRFPFTDVGVAITMQGVGRSDWEDSDATQFFDVSEGDLPQIYTETKQEEAPFKYELKTKRNIRPGTYSLEFIFTYYNGECWVTTTKNIEFKVQNFLEKYSVQIGIIAGLASISALIRFAVIPIGKWLSQFCW